MNPITNYDQITEQQDFVKLPAGGYVCRIQDAEDVADKQYLKIYYDIAEGEYKGFYDEKNFQDRAYMHRFVRSYKEKALPMFKSFISAIEKSNNVQLADKVKAGTLNPNDVKSKLIGLVIGYEEYQADNGEVKQRSRIVYTKSVDQIRSGDFKVPELKKLDLQSKPVETATGFTPADDAELPF